MKSSWIRMGAGAALIAGQPLAQADDWTIHMTVDNQFEAYLGTASATTSTVGSGAAWSTTFTFNATGATAADYFYVATSSDHSGLQGFLGDFMNDTTGFVFNTGSPVWEVFPVGAHLQQIDPAWPASWPPMLMPTQFEVDQALAYAVANPSVWIAPSTSPNWDNRVAGNVSDWGHRPGIDPNTQWIWNNITGGNPFKPGHNHNEFLIFRVPGVPEPGSLVLLTIGGLAALARRR